MVLDEDVRRMIHEEPLPIMEKLMQKYIKKEPIFDERRPFYQGDPGLVKVVSQNELDYASPDEERPIIATFGILTCAAIVGYDSNSKLAFLLHADEQDDVPLSIKMVHQTISDAIGTYQMDVRIIGGVKYHSDTFIKEVLESVQTNSSWTIIEQDTLDTPIIKSIALDTRDGQTYSYRPQNRI